MTGQTPIEDMKHEASRRAIDHNGRTRLWLAIALQTLAILVLVFFLLSAYFDEKAKTQTLSQQITSACDSGDFGPDISEERIQNLCDTAEKVQDDPGATVIEGVPGADGQDGVDGQDGIDGRNGIDGRDGKDGANGKRGPPGSDGEDGTSGTDGAPGADGLNGADGADGADGTNGTDGADGKDGADAVPFTFRFTVNQGPFSTTYICRIESANATFVCQEDEGQ